MVVSTDEDHFKQISIFKQLFFPGSRVRCLIADRNRRGKKLSLMLGSLQMGGNIFHVLKSNKTFDNRNLIISFICN